MLCRSVSRDQSLHSMRSGIWSPPSGSSRMSRTGSGICLREPTARGSRPGTGRKGLTGGGWSGRDCRGEDDPSSLTHSPRNETAEAMTTSPLRVHSGSTRARKASPMLFRSRHAARVLAGKGADAQPGAHDAGIEQVGAHPALADLAGIDLDEHVEAGLADRIGAPVGEAARDPEVGRS